MNALLTPRNKTLTYNVKLDHKHPSMVVTHNQCNTPQWVAELQRDVNNSNDQMWKVLPEPPFIAERNCKSLNSSFFYNVNSVTWFIVGQP